MSREREQYPDLDDLLRLFELERFEQWQDTFETILAEYKLDCSATEVARIVDDLRRFLANMERRAMRP